MEANDQITLIRYCGYNRDWRQEISLLVHDTIASAATAGQFIRKPLEFSITDNSGVCELRHGYSNANKMYFFPYFSGTTPPEFCIVPVACDFGTLVSTGGMNGCTLHIYRTNEHYIFIHDNNHQSVDSDNFAKRLTEDYKLGGIQHKVISLTEIWYWPKNYKSERKFRTFIPMISIRRSELVCHFSVFRFETEKGMKDPIPVRNENRLFYIDSTTGTVNNIF